MAREDARSSETYEDLHKAFHMTLLENCASPILLRFCNQLYDLNVRYRYLAGRSLNYRNRHVGDEHAAILDAAVRRDVDPACTRLLNHYKKTGAFLRQADMVPEG